MHACVLRAIRFVQAKKVICACVCVCGIECALHVCVRANQGCGKDGMITNIHCSAIFEPDGAKNGDPLKMREWKHRISASMALLLYLISMVQQKACTRNRQVWQIWIFPSILGDDVISEALKVIRATGGRKKNPIANRRLLAFADFSEQRIFLSNPGLEFVCAVYCLQNTTLA